VRVMVNRAALPEGKGRLPVLMNRGAWRHPVFGDRENWQPQSSQRGWWDEPGARLNPVLRQRLLQVLRETESQISV